jgi:uncharacterized protein YjbJ (UPF0337 family)
MEKPQPQMKRSHFVSLQRFINSDVYSTNMSKDEVEGRGKKVKGQIREEVGKITDNKTEQIKGKIEQVEGKVQEEVGKIKRKAKS